MKSDIGPAVLEMGKTQDTHWWFAARRSILRGVLTHLAKDYGSRRLRILEVGCGPGTNLRLLAAFGTVVGLDACDLSIDLAGRALADRNDEGARIRLVRGAFPECIPNAVETESFDLVCMLDVLEHIERDDEALWGANRCLVKDGSLILTVPACPALFGPHDEVQGHYRRYGLEEIATKIRNAGFDVEYASYMNVLLFPLMAVSRAVSRFTGRPMGTKCPPRPMNVFFRTLFAAERFCFPRFRFPFGGSILCTAKRKN